MPKNKTYRILVVISFPFFWAYFIGNTVLDILTVMLATSVLGDFKVFSIIAYSYTSYPPLLLTVANIVAIWGLFYLVLFKLFKRDRLFERIYEFSVVLWPAVIFGVLLFANNVLVELIDGVISIFSLAMSFSVLVVFIFFPLMLCELFILWRHIKKAKDYSSFKSLGVTFLIFILIPFAVNYFIKKIIGYIVYAS